MRSQTDPEFYGWAFAFITSESENVEWRQALTEEHKKWLEGWEPPEEWKQ